ncbi:MAG: tetratricopeptide repeat protein [Lysobacterales bacterium]
MNLFQELKRRNVVKVGLLYLVTSWVVLQIADVLFGLLTVPDWTLRFVLGLLLLGLPFALVFSWVFEMTPEGIKREKDIDRTQSITPHTGRKMNAAILGMFILSAALVGFQIFGSRSPSPLTDVSALADRQVPAVESTKAEVPVTTTNKKPSLAVLPFNNSSADKDQSYFSDGLADSLIHVLSQIDGLTVMARTSSFSFRGKGVDVQTIARELGVDTVLEGSVQSAGGQLRIIATLVDAADGGNLWSKQFDRSSDNVFAIQDEISREVVAALKGGLLAQDSAEISERYEPSLEAYNALLRGREQLAMRTPESVKKAEAHFREALSFDPQYPRALVNLGDSLIMQEEYGTAPLSDVIDEAEQLLRQALKLNPDLAEAYTSLAMLSTKRGLDDLSLSLFERAIELKPNFATAYHWQYIALRDLGKTEQAVDSINKAVALDPLSDVIQVNLIGALWITGKKQQSQKALLQAIENNPDFPGYYDSLAFQQYSQGNLSKAYQWTALAAKRFPGALSHRHRECFLLAHMADHERANQCIDGLHEINEQRAVSARMLTALFFGDIEAVISTGERFISESDAVSRDYERFLLSRAYLTAGRWRDAQSQIAAIHPELADVNTTQFNRNNVNIAVELGLIDAKLGNTAAAQTRLETALDFIQGQDRISGLAIGLEDARIHALLGNHELAMTALNDAITQGVRTYSRWSLLYDPALTPLHQDPEYQRLVSVVEMDLQNQLDWLDNNPEPPTL